MKILLINTFYYPNLKGGAEISIQILAETLVKNGIDVVVVTTSPKEFSGVKFLNDVKVYYIGIKNLYWPFNHRKNEMVRILWHTIDSFNPFMKTELGKIIQKEKPNIVHTNNLSGFSVSVWQIIKKFRLPLVHTIRDYYLLCHLSTMYRNGNNCKFQCLRCRIYSKSKKYMSNFPDSVIGISQYVLDHHLKFGLFKKVKKKYVIHNSYKDNKIEFSNCNNGKLRIGYLGRIEKAKGIEYLLESLIGIKEIDIELHIGGKGDQSYLDYLKNKYSNKAIYHGYIEQSKLFGYIDLLIVPSLWNEPFGRTIIEAMNYGIPCIGSNKGGIPELIDDGKNGFLFDPDEENSLADMIKKIAVNRRIVKEMKHACSEKASLFSPENICDKHIALYKSILQYI